MQIVLDKLDQRTGENGEAGEDRPGKEGDVC